MDTRDLQPKKRSALCIYFLVTVLLAGFLCTVSLRQLENLNGTETWLEGGGDRSIFNNNVVVSCNENSNIEQGGKRDSSRDATVIGMAQGYGLDVHRRFVGSLRKSGFTGTIMLATEHPDTMKPGVHEYLLSKNVTILPLKFVPCDLPVFEDDEVKNKKQKEGNTCIHPYSHIKIRWSRYPFLADALRACKECTGPVMMTDTRDTVFQRDPFGDGAHEVDGLHFFAEHHSIDASHWFVARRVRECKDGFKMNGPMLCSGTVIGDRNSMLSFIQIMYEEMQLWQSEEKCRFKSHGGDQAIMNFLFYNGAFKGVKTNIFRPKTGTVNTVGVIGTAMSRRSNNARKEGKEGLLKAGQDNWIDPSFDLTDWKGFFIDVDGRRSRAIHQYDRFGNAPGNLLKKLGD